MPGPWRNEFHNAYRRVVPRRPKAQPVPQPTALAGWEGHWVALLDDEVVAAAHNPRELAAKLHEMGPDVAKAVARYVPEHSDVIVIGVG